MIKIDVRTSSRTELIDITGKIEQAVRDAGVRDGFATVFVPHTTAAVTINENADPSVPHDILKILDSVIPFNSPHYRHGEGNSAAHIKSSLFGAVARFLGLELDPYRIAETIRYIELNYMDIQCGYQDQYMTVFGGINYLDFRTKEIYRDLDDEVFGTVEPLARFVDELPMTLVHTGVQRISGNILKPVRERWLEGDPAVVEGYSEIAGLARSGKIALIRRDWEALGALMNRNHEIQKFLGASGPVNDHFIGLALESGALGAKLAGAGGGGTIIALHLEPEKMLEAFRREGEPKVLTLDPRQEGLVVREVS